VFLQKDASPEDLGLWKEEHIEKLAANKSIYCEQIQFLEFNWRMLVEKLAQHLHGRHKRSRDQGGWDSVAPWDSYHESEKPIALDENGIHKVIADFKAATIRAVKAGYQVMEIHAACVYCISFFLLINVRTDAYGGSFEQNSSDT
jgi:hypothetical protein